MGPPEHHHPHHSGCSHEQDDEHLKPDEGTQDFLYSKIDRDQVSGCNIEPNHPAKNCIKTWSDRLNDENFTESDVDQQMIIHIPFTGSIKLRSLIVRTIPDEFRLTQLELYVNQPGLDFDQLQSNNPTQTLEIPETDQIIEFPLRVTKFSSVTNLSIFLTGQTDKTKIYFLGFKGEFSQISRKPIVTLYESQANPSDHKKISGLDNNINQTI